MKRLAAFVALPLSDKGLLLRAALLLLVLRLALPLLSIERLRRWAGRPGHARQPAERIVWAVRRAALVIPGVTCLCGALALQRLLSRARHPSELHIGVARREAALAAHAWLVHDGKVLLGGEQSDSFTGLLAWRSGADPA